MNPVKNLPEGYRYDDRGTEEDSADCVAGRQGGTMTNIDLITGFLGAGKTTFLLRYARWLMRQGLHIAILVYDHGAVNVDMPLLHSLRGEQCEIEMLAGACDPDCHRRRFRTKLISLGMRGFDRVLIEPSGVFDMDEYFDTLNESPLDRWFEPGSVVCVVDAKLDEAMTPEEDFFLASQVLSAGCVLLSRVQLASEEEIARTQTHLERACTAISVSGDNFLPRVLAKDWAELTDADFRRLEGCGFRAGDYVKRIAGEQSAFQSLSFLDLPLGRAGLEEKTRRLFADETYGKILRVKGFFEEGGQWYEMNATSQERNTAPVPGNRGAIIVIGMNLNEDAISLLLTGKAPEHHIL